MDAPHQALQRKLPADRFVRFHRAGASSVADRLSTPKRLWVDERLVELDNWTGYRFTDLFTLLKVGGEWQIMNKVFHLHQKQPPG